MFASMMIEHHTQAIEMSDTLLSKDGIDERVTALAEQIKAAQEPRSRRWKAGWRTGVRLPPTWKHGSRERP